MNLIVDTDEKRVK